MLRLDRLVPVPPQQLARSVPLRTSKSSIWCQGRCGGEVSWPRLSRNVVATAAEHEASLSVSTTPRPGSHDSV